MRVVRWVWGILCFGVGILGLIWLSAYIAAYSDGGGSGGPLVMVFIAFALGVWLIGLGILQLAAWIYRRVR